MLCKNQNIIHRSESPSESFGPSSVIFKSSSLDSPLMNIFADPPQNNKSDWYEEHYKVLVKPNLLKTNMYRMKIINYIRRHQY